MTGADAAKRLGGELAGGEILCPGPNHSDADRSLSVKLDDDAPDGFVVHSFAGDDPIACRDHVRGKLGLPPFEPKGRKKNGGAAAWKLISEHIYRDAAGAPYLQLRRWLDDEGKKQYPQFRWDGAQWVKGKPKGAKIPYRLPALLAAPVTATVYIVEGEKCCDALAKLGFVVTTNSEGVDNGTGKKWTADLNGYFKDRHVVILADNDVPGREHVQHVAKNLHGVAATVRTLDLAQHWPGEPMPEHDDVADWITRHDRAGSKLAALAKDAPLWEPGAEPAGDADDDALIAELAALSELAYARRHKEAARGLGIAVADLDRIVRRARGEREDDEDKAQPSLLYEHWDVEPWPHPVDGETLLRALGEKLGRYVVMDRPQRTVCALWVMLAWVHERAVIHSPILLVNSAMSGSGKTTLLHLIGFLARRGLTSVLITGAALFRSIEKWSPTIAIDDADKAFVNNDDLREVVNSGWTRGECVIRCDPETHDPRPYKTFCPKAIGMIGRGLRDDTFTRCLMIPMRRKRPDEHAEEFEHIDDEDLARLRSQLSRWADDNAEALARARPEIPPGLHNRARMNRRMLLAIAERCRAKKAAWEAVKTVEEVSATADPELAAQLLSDIRDAFGRRNTDRLTTKELLAGLAGDAEGPWLSYGKAGKPLSDRQLGRLLKDFRRGKGIKSKTIRVGPNSGDTARGYERADFEEDFAAYLASEGGYPPFPSDTSDTTNDFNDLEEKLSDTEAPDVSDENSPNPLKTNDVSDVSDKKGGTGEKTHSQPLGRCAQCNGLAADAPLDEALGVCLHERCRAFWLRRGDA